MSPITRTFTVAELAALGVPPDDPDDIQYSDILLADEHVTTLKYSQQRRCVFRADDGTTWAVEYETEVDSGDYEHGPGPDNHGWYGDTVEATAMEQRTVTVMKWLPVDDQQPAPGPRFRRRPAEVQAIQWTDGNADQLTAFAGSRFHEVAPEDRDDPAATATLLESEHSSWSDLLPGDWVVKRGEDQFEVLTAEEFAEMYEPAGDQEQDR